MTEKGLFKLKNKNLDWTESVLAGLTKNKSTRQERRALTKARQGQDSREAQEQKPQTWPEHQQKQRTLPDKARQGLFMHCGRGNTGESNQGQGR